MARLVKSSFVVQTLEEDKDRPNEAPPHKKTGKQIRRRTILRLTRSNLDHMRYVQCVEAGHDEIRAIVEYPIRLHDGLTAKSDT